MQGWDNMTRQHVLLGNLTFEKLQGSLFYRGTSCFFLSGISSNFKTYLPFFHKFWQVLNVVVRSLVEGITRRKFPLNYYLIWPLILLMPLTQGLILHIMTLLRFYNYYEGALICKIHSWQKKVILRFWVYSYMFVKAHHFFHVHQICSWSVITLGNVLGWDGMGV